MDIYCKISAKIVGQLWGWKMCRLSKLSSVTMTERTFVPRTSPSPWGDKPIRLVFAQV